MPRSEADCSRPKRLLRVMSASTRGADAGLAVGIATGAAGDDAAAVVLRRSGLGLEAEAIGQRPAPRLCRLQQHGLVGFAAGGVLDGRIDLVEEGKVVEIALRFQQRRLVERVAGMQRDGLGHRLRAGVVQPGQQHLAHKNLLPLGDVEDHVHLVRVGRLNLLGDLDPHLVEAPAQVVGQQRVPVPGQVRGESNCPARCSAAASAWPHAVCSFPSMRTVPTRSLLAFFDAVDHGQRSASFPTLACSPACWFPG